MHIGIGLAIGAAVLLAGVLALMAREESYTAQSSVMIAPARAEEAVQAADTLSRGTVVGTFSEAFSSDGVVDQALAAQGIGPDERAAVEVESRPMAGASAVLIHATAGSADLAERAAGAVALASPPLGAYSDAFQVAPLQGAEGTAERDGVGSGVLLLLLLIVSAAVAVGVTAASRRLFGDQPPAPASPSVPPVRRDRRTAPPRSGSPAPPYPGSPAPPR
jgi:hypothetical protein